MVLLFDFHADPVSCEVWSRTLQRHPLNPTRLKGALQLKAVSGLVSTTGCQSFKILQMQTCQSLIQPETGFLDHAGFSGSLQTARLQRHNTQNKQGQHHQAHQNFNEGQPFLRGQSNIQHPSSIEKSRVFVLQERPGSPDPDDRGCPGQGNAHPQAGESSVNSVSSSSRSSSASGMRRANSAPPSGRLRTVN